MHVVERIFVELGESTAIANATGIPVQTVNSWKMKGNIPHWRRQGIIDAAQRLGKSLAPDLAAYLASTDAPPMTDAEAA